MKASRKWTALVAILLAGSNAPLPVDCLTWAYAGLYACADEAIAGFTIGVSTDGGETFTPILHLKDLTPASCASASSAGSCAAQWCSTANAAPCRRSAGW